MAASVGFLVQESGLHFGGLLSKTPEISFESLSGMGALDAWAAVPIAGKAQIMMAAGLIEAFAEAKKPVRCRAHTASAARWVGIRVGGRKGGWRKGGWRGRLPGRCCATPHPPSAPTLRTHPAPTPTRLFPSQHYMKAGMPQFEGKRARGRMSELKNGRLAMIAVASYYAGVVIPGSVPMLPGTWH